MLSRVSRAASTFTAPTLPQPVPHETLWRCAKSTDGGTSHANANANENETETETDPASTRALKFLDHFQFIPAGVEVIGDALPGGREAPVFVGLSCASVVLVNMESQLVALGAGPVFNCR